MASRTGESTVAWPLLLDCALLATLAAATLFAIAFAARQNQLPFEDAAMLLRYSQHLAWGHGIVWNAGEPPVDGATDFLFMAAVAAMSRLGTTVEAAGRALTSGAHLVTVLFLYFGIRRLHSGSPWLAFAAGLYLAFGPALVYVAAFFGTPCFALAALVSWYFALSMMLGRAGRWAPVAFAYAAFIASLIRPEGCLLTVFMLAAVLLSVDRTAARSVAWAFFWCFVAPGIAYFVWRWSYFGHPLPNPFYKKGGHRLHLGAMFQAARNVFGMGLPLWPIYLVAAALDRKVRYIVLTLIPVACFTACWVLVSDEMNYGARFQYVVLPILLLSSAPVVAEVAEALGLRGLGRLPPGLKFTVGGALAVAALLAGFALRASYPTTIVNYTSLGVLGKKLRSYAGKKYRLAVTEAGLLPLYSEWDATDLWGLNDATIAHGGLTVEYLDRHPPDLIMMHAYSTPLHPAEGGEVLRGWNGMVAVLKKYVAERDYDLVAVFCHNVTEGHWYFVRRGNPDAQELARVIRDMDYDWEGPTMNIAACALAEPFQTVERTQPSER